MKERLHGLLAGLFLPAMLLAAGCSGSGDDIASERAANDPRVLSEKARSRELVEVDEKSEEPTKEEPVAQPVAPRPAPKPAPAPVKPRTEAKVADAPPAPPAPVVEAPRPVAPPPAPVVETRPVVESPRPEPRVSAPIYVPSPPPAPVVPVEPDRPAPPPAPVNRQVTIPSGTLIPVRMIDSVDSRTDKPGQTFLGSIDEAVVVNGEVVIARNSDVVVKLVQAKTSGQLAGRSELQLSLDRLTVAKKSYVVESNVFQTQGASQTTTTVRNTGVGAGLGALIGGLAGGKKGAAIGAGVGGGAGAAAAVMAKGDQVRVPAETKLTFRLESSVDVTLVGPPVAPTPASSGSSNPPVANPSRR